MRRARLRHRGFLSPLEITELGLEVRLTSFRCDGLGDKAALADRLDVASFADLLVLVESLGFMRARRRMPTVADPLPLTGHPDVDAQARRAVGLCARLSSALPLDPSNRGLQGSRAFDAEDASSLAGADCSMARRSASRAFVDSKPADEVLGARALRTALGRCGASPARGSVGHLHSAVRRRWGALPAALVAVAAPAAAHGDERGQPGASEAPVAGDTARCVRDRGSPALTRQRGRYGGSAWPRPLRVMRRPTQQRQFEFRTTSAEYTARRCRLGTDECVYR